MGATNLGGRTLADLILGRETLLTRQPWVLGDGPLTRLSAWEPEPCRWLGYNAIIRSFVHEDRVLANPRAPLAPRPGQPPGRVHGKPDALSPAMPAPRTDTTTRLEALA